MAAVVGSSSTPIIDTASGAVPMNTPAPQPGSNTRPPVVGAPSSISVSQIARAYSTCV